MPSSTLDVTEESAPVTTRGHGTDALGPSDSSDSGSDIVGGPGMDEGLSDEQSRQMPETIHASAGRDIGDLDVDSDSDATGTGERGSSGVDAAPVDQMLTVEPAIDAGEDEFDDPDALADDDVGADAASSDRSTDAGDDDESDVSDGAT